MAHRDSDPFLGRPTETPAPRDGERAYRLRALAGRLVFGGGLIAAGVIATFDNLGVLDGGDYFLLWPLLVIAFGATQLFGTRHLSERLGASLWILVGALFLASNLGWMRVDVWDLSPALIAVLGIVLIVRALRPRRTDAPATSEIHAFAFLSGINRSSSSPTFRGGSLTAVMGGSRIDLSAARLAGGTAILDVLAFWGGIDIVVPPRWRVENRVVPLLGGADDHTSPPAPEDAEGVLQVTGWAVMGGVDIKNQSAR